MKNRQTTNRDVVKQEAFLMPSFLGGRRDSESFRAVAGLQVVVSALTLSYPCFHSTAFAFPLF